jgi:glutamine---fructose-6-phosphate transaminase (isomerizing)
MCGIFGHVGVENSTELCLNGLKLLEYRGYDSAGIAGVYLGELFAWKETGKLSELEQAVKKNPINLNLAIAHTRWATHGIPTKENAHPHFDESQSVAVVHNGIIENHHALRTMLQNKGVSFVTHTDTEVIAQLVSHFYQGNLVSAVHQALSLMKGTWGLALIHKNHPNQIIAAARENTLAVALDPQTQEAFVSSDANSFQRPGLDVTFLHKGDIALVSNGKIEFYNQEGMPIFRKSETFTSHHQVLSKNGFDHFMLKEIFEQPHTIQQAIHKRMDTSQGTAHFEELTPLSEELSKIDNIQILACGTSWHAGCFASLLLEEKARIPSRAEIASEYRHKNPIVTPNTLVLAISQSGETLDTLMATREAKARGAKVLAVCNVPHSTLAREADALLNLRAGPEISVCSTKAFTSQISVLTLFALYMARVKGTTSSNEGQAILQSLNDAPQLVTSILNQHDAIQSIAKKYARYENFFFLGRHDMYFAALEAALKLKEISYLNATGYPAGELKHGPIALLDEGVPVIGMLGNLHSYEKLLSNLLEVKSRRSPILAFAPEGAEQIAELAHDVIWLPPTSDIIGYSVACQLLAYYIAKERGTDIDQPRNLAKSVTVE